MCRFVAFLLISLIGFQTSWAAVASCCQHEQGAAARHVGHHEHQHHHKSLINAVEDAQQNSQKNPASAGVDLDCSFCHAAGIMALLPDLDPAVTIQATLNVSYRLILHPPSAPHDLPERPNWS